MSGGSKAVAEEKVNGLGPGTIEIDGEILATETLEFRGERIVVRELLTSESDDAWDAALQPDGKTINTRLNTRMQMAKALVEPRKTIEEVSKLGSQKFLVILGAFNRLNSLPEGNPTPPAGSAGPTQPDGGAASPAT